jgi:hypothetical protein
VQLVGRLLLMWETSKNYVLFLHLSRQDAKSWASLAANHGLADKLKS